MASNRVRRIQKEIKETASDIHSKVFIEIGENGDVDNLEGTFLGPPDTPYEGGTFCISITIPTDYPFRPPKMKFKTRIWHPNVSSQTVCLFLGCSKQPSSQDSRDLADLAFQGAICLDTLSSNWSPVLTIKSALISIQGLLASPEPKDPQDAEVASMLLKNPKEFERIAREWSVKYAGAPAQLLKQNNENERKAQESSSRSQKEKAASGVER